MYIAQFKGNSGLCAYLRSGPRYLSVTGIDSFFKLAGSIVNGAGDKSLNLANLPDELTTALLDLPDDLGPVAPVSHPEPSRLSIWSSVARPIVRAMVDAPFDPAIPFSFASHFLGNGFQLPELGDAVNVTAFDEGLAVQPGIAGVYIIDRDGFPYRLGWTPFAMVVDVAPGVQLSDGHGDVTGVGGQRVMFGQEVFLGELPDQICGNLALTHEDGSSRDYPLQSGGAHLLRPPAYQEQAHFRNPQRRRPGDIHVIRMCHSPESAAPIVPIDVCEAFELAFPDLGSPLRAGLQQVASHEPIMVRRVGGGLA